MGTKITRRYIREEIFKGQGSSSKEENLPCTDESLKCTRCRRPLKTAESRQLGMGPVCYQKWLKKRPKPTLF